MAGDALEMNFLMENVCMRSLKGKISMPILLVPMPCHSIGMHEA